MLLLTPASSLVKLTQALPLRVVQMARFLVPSKPWPFSSRCLLVCLQCSMTALTTSAFSSLLPASCAAQRCHLILSTQVGHPHHQVSQICFMQSAVATSLLSYD